MGRYLASYPNPDGSIDTTFHTDGHVILPVSPTKPSITKQPIVIQPSDGAIVWAGTDYNGTDNDLAMVRCTTDGRIRSGVRRWDWIGDDPAPRPSSPLGT